MKVFSVTPTSRVKLEELSILILSEFDSSLLVNPNPLNVRRLLDVYMPKKFSWNVDYREDIPMGVLGYCDPKTRSVCLPEEASDLLDKDGRTRFTATHEFSHVVKHGRQMLERMVSFDPKEEMLFRQEICELKPYTNPEWQANYLAAALLMPRPMVARLIQERGPKGIEYFIARTFKVSLEAAEVRLSNLKRMN